VCQGAWLVKRIIPAKIRVLGHTVPVVSHKTLILNDPAAPVQITKAGVYRLDWGMKEATDILLSDRSIRVRDIPKGPIILISAASKSAVAVQFGVQFYDSFDRHEGGFNATIMTPPKNEMEWHRRKLSFTFEKFGIACVYVSSARLKDGKVWRANTKKIATMMVAEGCGAEPLLDNEKRLKELPKGVTRL